MYIIHERLPDVTKSVAGLAWHTKCIQAKAVYRNVKRIEPHVYYLYNNMQVCVPPKPQSFSLHELGCLVFSLGFFFFFVMCEQIFSPGSNANFESVSAEQPDNREGTASGLNLLMSRLPLIRNQLLIQIHTLMLL